MAPAPTLDVSRSSPELTKLFQAFFVAKSSQDAGGESSAFSKDRTAYGDVVMGWLVEGHDQLEAALKKAVANYGDGRSYHSLIMGELREGDGSALVAVTNTPEIVGSELRMLSTVDFRSNKIVRWVDYWDSLSFDDAIMAEKRTPDAQFPVEYFEQEVGVAAAEELVDVASRLHRAMAGGDAEAAAALFDDDAVVEDMALRVQVIGRRAITRYFGHLLPTAPFGTGSRLRHIVGGKAGGGLEWVGSNSARTISGVTALSLSPSGKVVRATSVYDSRLLAERNRRNLVLLSTSA